MICFKKTLLHKKGRNTVRTEKPNELLLVNGGVIYHFHAVTDLKGAQYQIFNNRQTGE
jgi:hypothetical protein